MAGESGLSIMEWAPLSGAIPPLSEAEWQRLFAIYQQIPEYQEENLGMSLEDFKAIFWWEYIHRLWGRLLGLVFGLPLLYFWIRGRIRGRLARHLWGILALGALQGFLGWFMVASGFADRTDVSQYRLVIHLMMAVFLFVYVLIIGLQLVDPRGETAGPQKRLRRAAFWLAVLVMVTMASGGFVAGLNAGFFYNSLPYMGEGLVPDDYVTTAPWLLNLFESPAAVQFNHRLLALIAFLAILLFALQGLRKAPTQTGVYFRLVILALFVQIGLGVATLLLVVPVSWAAAHQGGAFLLLTALLITGHRLARATR
jgi:cytochrome c oxidase assembly protein subunit 15